MTKIGFWLEVIGWKLLHFVRFSKRFLPISRVDLLADISLRLLYYHGIRGVILDLDNTIVSEDDRYVSPEAEAWIDTAKRASFKLLILTNGKREGRIDYWTKRLGVPAIHPACKPFPKAFRQALNRMQLKPHQVVVIGDSLHTDRLGAWFVGCPMIQVASLPHPKRSWERVIGRVVHRSYPHDRELWTITDSNVNC
ncbi:YqeG family HAD IIIA-type phosphatase [Leptolyngbya sp. FACHB-17]|uniref:YqeG family HAD IIIA-type phosphatase n=1 Tax=unclassified Leptolyngbya TaxID=2650499 RepID=UPI001680DC5C|nr:YqeG family HAD IIIA-type phosphatase [Leptolyngbya sp. FACHB-17]MBD2080270.1 YqeG family HAD IIIA-type phosphatase [Leptolyngbya sp. FACHB-17]